MTLNRRFIGLMAIIYPLLTGCITAPPDDVSERPGDKSVSILTGSPGGFKLSDLAKGSELNNGMPVNALLWRAALDIASFAPLDDVDTFGGTIVTEWHQPKDSSDKRLKLTMFVIGRELRSDAITVRAYVQNRVDSDWVDSGRDEVLGRKLEDLVLTRARELRAATSAESVN